MLQNLLLNIDAGTIDWSRAQFALTAIYHWLFVPLTLGLALIMGIMETIWYRTRKPFWRDVSQFWQRLFGINFAMGVATGIILEFEFGTNWSNYSWFVGDIFGAPLAIEGIVAFFMESTFVAVMYFGWKKVSPGFHLASTWLTGLGATISAWWILVANAWMQYPVGCAFNPDTMRNEMVSFLDVALSPFAIDKFCHTVISAWIIGAIFVVAVSCWYLMKNREIRLAKESIKIAAIVGLIASLGAGMTGHKSAQSVAEVQPMKLAAMEALYDGGYDQGLTLVPGIEMPYMLSFMATNDFHAFVPGIDDILNGYTRADGTEEPSVNEKIARGKLAIQALADYRKSRGCSRRRSYAAVADAQREHALLRLRLYERQARRSTTHLGQLLGFPHHGGCRLSVHPLLPAAGHPVVQDTVSVCHHTPPVGHRWHPARDPGRQPRHCRTARLALLASHPLGTPGLYRLREWLAGSRVWSSAMDHPGHAAHMGGCQRHREFLGSPDVLPLPVPLHADALRGDKYHA